MESLVWIQYTPKNFFVLNCYEFFNTFSIHLEIFNTSFNTPWNFQHFSIYLEIFNTVFKMPWNFQHSLQHALTFSTWFSTCIDIFKTVFNMFSAHFKIENFKHLHSNCNWTHPENCVKSNLILYVLWMLWIQVIHNNKTTFVASY